jgi:hypothetical protein
MRVGECLADHGKFGVETILERAVVHQCCSTTQTNC